jgi:hypothetical protein
MPDLELLRAFRADTPELSDERFQALRSAYRTRTPTPPARRRHGRRVALVALAAAACVAILLTLETRGQQTAAAAVLRHAASQLDSAPSTPLPTGSYWYIRTRERTLGETSYRADGGDKIAALFTNETTETWLANDGSGAQRGIRSAPFGLTPAARAAKDEFDRTQRPQTYAPGFIYDGPTLLSVSLGNKALNPANLASLPTDPDALQQLIASIDSPPGTSPHEIAVAEFEEISNALFFEPFDPAVTAALYRVLATLPDIQSLGQRQDSAGRTGVEIAITNGGSRLGVIVDPNTGQLFERTETKIASSDDDNQVPVGTQTWRQTIVHTSIVSGLALQPDGTQLDTTHWTICKPDPQPGSPSQGHCTDR